MTSQWNTTQQTRLLTLYIVLTTLVLPFGTRDLPVPAYWLDLPWPAMSDLSCPDLCLYMPMMWWSAWPDWLPCMNCRSLHPLPVQKLWPLTWSMHIETPWSSQSTRNTCHLLVKPIYVQHNTIEGLSSAGRIQGLPADACKVGNTRNGPPYLIKWPHPSIGYGTHQEQILMSLQHLFFSM